jgi:hypothetical protein
MKTAKKIGMDLLLAAYFLQLPAIVAYLVMHL